MADPICELGCDAELPLVDFDDCNPEVSLSEIRKVYVGKAISAPFTDWTDPSEWAARLSETSTTGDDYIRPLTVIGDLPAATNREKVISNDRRVVTGKDRTINFEIDESTDANYDFLRQLECGVTVKRKVWFETMGNKLFGGNYGIDMYLTGNIVLDRGTDGIERYLFIGTWQSKFSPERTISPIA